MFRNLSLYSYCRLCCFHYTERKYSDMFCNKQYTGNKLREDNFLEETYKVAWLCLTYYLKLKAVPLSILKTVQKISLRVPFVLPVCTSENLWEVFRYSFDLFSVCTFFWLWKCSHLHSMSWQTEHFLIQKRNHCWFF